jgi:hypothetical protein
VSLIAGGRRTLSASGGNVAVSVNRSSSGMADPVRLVESGFYPDSELRFC